MLRNFGISLLLFGLLAAGIDGFRVRDRVRNAAPSNGITTTEDTGVHSAELGVGIGPK
jgi:hypothetical protein